MNFIAIILTIFGGAIVAANAYLLTRHLVWGRPDRSISSIPIIGGITAALGMLLSSNQTLRTLAWVPLLIDSGGLPAVALLLWYRFRRAADPATTIRPAMPIGAVRSKVDQWNSQQFGTALSLWTGWKNGVAPFRDDAAVIDHFGSREASRLLDDCRELEREFFASDANIRAKDLNEMAALARSDFLQKYPGVRLEVMEILESCYCFSNR